ncbi:Phosphohistidine phosphatase [Candidatus Electronema halotolerans]
MKKIHLLRHAKSSWEDASLADIDRPLNERGRKTCGFMAQHIAEAGCCCFAQVFCSPAVRAQATIELLSSRLPGAAVQWQTVEQLYTFESKAIWDWCRVLDESTHEPLLVGHNQALTDFCNQLSGSAVNNIPTCGYVQLVIKKECLWRELAEGAADLAVFLRPKKLMQ